MSKQSRDVFNEVRGDTHYPVLSDRELNENQVSCLRIQLKKSTCLSLTFCTNSTEKLETKEDTLSPVDIYSQEDPEHLTLPEQHLQHQQPDKNR